MWFEGLLPLAGALRDLSVGLSCPFHCGQSAFSFFVFGLACGLFLALILIGYLALLFRGFHLPVAPTQVHPPSGEPTARRLPG